MKHIHSIRTWPLLASLFLVAVIPSNGVQAQSSKTASALDKANVVAKKTMVNGSEVITCDLSKLKKTIDLPLSQLIETLEIVKLDGRDEALVGATNVTISEKHILVRNNKSNPYKLFDKKTGKFLTTIGSYGNGPGEYLNVYDDAIDELHQRIYLLPWQTKKVLVYDFSGKVLDPIPLPAFVPKGKIHIDPKTNVLSVVRLPFRDDPTICWAQKTTGDYAVINTFKSQALTIRPDYSNEVIAGNNTEGFDFYLFTFYEIKSDYLYHYDYQKNSLLPKFTLDFGKKPLKIHYYLELPHHFIGDVTVELKLTANTSTVEEPKYYIIDRKTLKGAYYNFYNDFFGNLPLSWPSFSNGYYVSNVDPGQLIHDISGQLERKDLTTKQRDYLTKLLKSINENDNNYILYGKLKK
jgi:hypothetical protein